MVFWAHKLALMGLLAATLAFGYGRLSHRMRDAMRAGRVPVDRSEGPEVQHHMGFTLYFACAWCVANALWAELMAWHLLSRGPGFRVAWAVTIVLGAGAVISGLRAIAAWAQARRSQGMAGVG